MLFLKCINNFVIAFQIYFLQLFCYQLHPLDKFPIKFLFPYSYRFNFSEILIFDSLELALFNTVFANFQVINSCKICMCTKYFIDSSYVLYKRSHCGCSKLADVHINTLIKIWSLSIIIFCTHYNSQPYIVPITTQSAILVYASRFRFP